MTIDLATKLEAVSLPISSTLSIPPQCYTDADAFQIEHHAVFRRSWIGLGRADRWAGPGDYSDETIAGVPTIIVRDTCGVLRGFANSCRHRGAKLLNGCGKAATISCPFHRWTYDLTGFLRRAPDMEQTPDFDQSDYGLIAFQVEERHGFAFICFDNTTPDIDTWMGDFGPIHEPWNLDGLVSTRRRELEVDCNWKGFLEVFNEYYHLPYVHPYSINDVYAPPDQPDDVTGNYTSQFGSTEGTGGLLEDAQAHALPPIPTLKGRNARGTRYTWMYPNMTFAASTEAIWVYDTLPLSPHRTRVGMTVCFPRETAETEGFEEKSAYYYKRMDDALAEDIPFLVNQHQGLRSPFARQGQFNVIKEPNVANFAVWYADQMRHTIQNRA